MQEKLKKLAKNISNNKENALLAKLWRSILLELNMLQKIDFLVNRYIKHTNSGKVGVIRKKNKSSIVNQLTADELTWRSFMDLLFNVLGVKKFKLTIELTHGTNRTSIHTLNVIKESEDSEDEPVQQ